MKKPRTKGKIKSALQQHASRRVRNDLSFMYSGHYYDVSDLEGRPGDLFIIYPCETSPSVFVELVEPDYTESGCSRLYPIPMNAAGQPLSAKVIQA